MIKYSQIKDLPTDHPLSLEFEKELEEKLDAYISGNDEMDSLDYFNRFIAGDR